MPLYEYRCHQCGTTFEVRQKFSDTPLTVHEGCGGEVEKLISLSAFQLKGTGWYATDYAKGKSSVTNGPNGKSDSKSESSKSDSKSETSKSETSKSENSKSEASSKSETSKSDTGKTATSKSESTKSESKPKPA